MNSLLPKLNEKDVEQAQERYTSRYKEFGYSPKSLGWLKGKQDRRFEILTSQYSLENKSVLDIGCGFGDLNKHLANTVSAYEYTGIDLCEVLIAKGRELFTSSHVNFLCGDFLAHNFERKFDWALASGIFNHVLNENNNYDFVYSVMKKCHETVSGGFSLDFIHDRVDYKDEHLFYANPETILSYAYSLSRRVVLRSDYMPFEFSIFVFKDDCFDREDTIFCEYKRG